MISKKIRQPIGWGVVSLIALVAVGGSVMYITEGRRGWPLTAEKLQACGERTELFNRWPIEADKVTAISPLGNMTPTNGEVFPNDRLMWQTKDAGDGTVSGKVESVAVNVPGDGWVTRVQQTEYWSDNKLIDKDYTVFFSPCEEVEAGFYNLHSLEASLDEDVKRELKEDISYVDGAVKVIERGAKVNLWRPSGAQIGWLGGGSQGKHLGWGLIDTRTKPLGFLNARKEKSGGEYAVCPLDYYAPNASHELAVLLGSSEKRRVEEPVCGEVNQDLVGTLQGRWYAEKTEHERGQDKHIALVHDAIEPQRPVLSVGTSLLKSGLQPGLYYFKLKSSGTINRDFSEANEAGVIYCYQGMQDQRNEATKRILLVELVDDKSVKVEARPGFSCASSNYIFSDRMTVFER